MAKKQIPDIVVGRLPLYLRSLQRMAQEGRQITKVEITIRVLIPDAEQVDPEGLTRDARVHDLDTFLRPGRAVRPRRIYDRRLLRGT